MGRGVVSSQLSVGYFVASSSRARHEEHLFGGGQTTLDLVIGYDDFVRSLRDGG